MVSTCLKLLFISLDTTFESSLEQHMHSSKQQFIIEGCTPDQLPSARYDLVLLDIRTLNTRALEDLKSQISGLIIAIHDELTDQQSIRLYELDFHDFISVNKLHLLSYAIQKVLRTSGSDRLKDENDGTTFNPSGSVEYSISGTWEWDIQTNEVSWDPNLYKIFELPKEQAPSFELYQSMIQEEYRESAIGCIMEALNNRSYFNNRYEISTQTGKTKHIRTWGKVMLNQDGAPMKMFGVCMDITDNLKIENTIKGIYSLPSVLGTNDFLENSCRYLCEALGVKLAMIAEYDKNKRSIAISGLPDTPHLNTIIQKVRNTPHEKVIQSGFFHCEENISDQFPGYKLLKQHDISSYMGVALKDQSDNVIGLIAIMCSSPMTEIHVNKRILGLIKKQTEFELQRSRTEKELMEYEKYFSLSMEFLCIATLDGYFKKLNPKFMEALGYSEEELLNKRLVEFVHQDDLEFTLSELKQLLKGKRTLKFTNRYITKSGECIYLSWTAVRDDNKDLVYGVARDVTETYLNKMALENTTKRLRLATSAAKMGIWEWDMTTNQLKWDDAMFEIFNVKKEEFDGDFASWERTVHPDDLEPAKAKITEALANKTALDTEFRIIWGDGSIKYIKVDGIVEYHTSGKPLRFIGLNYDITPVRQMEQVNKISYNILLNYKMNQRDFFKFIRAEIGKILNTENFYIGIIDGETLDFIYYYNEFDKEKTELPKARYRGNGLSEYVIRTGEGLLLRGDEVLKFHHKHNFKIYGDVAKTWMGSPISIDGKVIGVVACLNFVKESIYSEQDLKIFSKVGTEIGSWLEKQRMNEALQRSIEQYKNVVQDQTEFIVRWKPTGEIMFANTSWLEYQQLTLNDIKSLNYYGLVSSENTSRFINKISKLSVDSPVSVDIHEAIHSTFGKRWEEWADRVFFDEEGNISEYQSIGRDITEQVEAQKIQEAFTNQLETKVKERTLELVATQKRLESALEKEKELNELKSQFVSMTSHQFRTPMAIIQSNSELVELVIQQKRMESKDLQLLDNATERIRSEVRRMTNLMDEVLALGKISSGVLVPKKEKISLQKLCTKVTEMFNEIQRDNRQLELVTPNHEIKSNLDENLMNHALANLITNAFKYSPGQANPVMTLATNQKQINISVKDFGIGIPKKDLPNLFQPFYRAENAHDYQGTGLGLKIAKEYIELNGGTLSVKSTINEGTICEITLPTDSIPQTTDNENNSNY